MDNQTPKLKYKVISEALEGEVECGDQYLVKELTGSQLIAVIDGLGHGIEAAKAANKAIQIIDANANQNIEDIFKICDQELHNMRGAAMTVVKIDANYKLTYMAIGNVMGVCWKMDKDRLTRQSLFLEGGIVGSRFSSFACEKQILMSQGDTLILATDGIKVGFENEPPSLESLEKIAQRIFTSYRNIKDDGLVLVVKLL
jgi:hypothetical protein